MKCGKIKRKSIKDIGNEDKGMPVYVITYIAKQHDGQPNMWHRDFQGAAEKGSNVRHAKDWPRVLSPMSDIAA